MCNVEIPFTTIYPPYIWYNFRTNFCITPVIKDNERFAQIQSIPVSAQNILDNDSRGQTITKKSIYQTQDTIGDTVSFTTGKSIKILLQILYRNQFKNGKFGNIGGSIVYEMDYGSPMPLEKYGSPRVRGTVASSGTVYGAEYDGQMVGRGAG